jgi:hypothetical protein
VRKNEPGWGIISKNCWFLLNVKHGKQTVCDFCAKVIAMPSEINIYNAAA